jgi:outer membrane receptor protein involved in Fe transport
VPEWVASVFAVKRFGRNFSVNSGVRHVSDRFANTHNSVVAGNYVVVDVGASYTWDRVTFTLRGRNLLDEEYEPVAGTTMRRLGDPRNFELSARYTF